MTINALLEKCSTELIALSISRLSSRFFPAREAASLARQRSGGFPGSRRAKQNENFGRNSVR
jgi:hypothetical protein